jgi:hypothetical protein
MKGDLIRLHMISPDYKPMHVYLERTGDRPQMVEFRDEHDKMSIKEMMNELPPQLQDAMRKLVCGVMDVIKQTLRLEQCHA